MNKQTNRESTGEAAWEDPQFIATQLRILSYPVTDWTPTDENLTKLAGLGYNPSELALRVTAACEYASIKRPAGFSPSNIDHVSRERVIGLANRAKVSARWLLTGSIQQIVEDENGPIAPTHPDFSDYPRFMDSYVDLARDARSIMSLISWYGGQIDDYSRPGQYAAAALGILSEAKKTEGAYLECRSTQKAFHAERAEFSRLLSMAENSLRNLEAFLNEPLGAGMAPEILKKSDLEGHKAQLLGSEYKKKRDDLSSHLNIAIMAADHYLERDCNRHGLDFEKIRSRIGDRGTRWVSESSVDSFYKMRPGGECGHFTRAIPNLPWIPKILPFILKADQLWENRDHRLTVSHEELEWLIHGFCDAVLSPTQGEKAHSFREWKKEADRNPGTLARMINLHEKLFKSMDCDTFPENKRRERKGSGRRK